MIIDIAIAFVLFAFGTLLLAGACMVVYEMYKEVRNDE